MRLALIALVALTGCATSPEYVASQSDYNVCRLSTTPFGGPAAKQEIARRRLDCRPYMGAIASDNAANAALIRSTQPTPIQQPMNCTSYRAGNTVQTDCR